MQFAFDAPGCAADLATIERRIVDIDPAALLDLDADGRTIRISTVLTPAELLDCLDRTGLPAESRHLRQLPSTCCGGCSG